jgi:chromosome segregation ATPase
LAKASISFPNLSSLEESKSAVALLEFEPHQAVSGQIFGVLSQMLEQMDADLAQRQKEESTAVETFNNVRKAKKEEIAATRADLRKNKDDLANTMEDLARAKKSIKETTDQLEVDRKFLADVNEKSDEDKAELARRVAAQSEELTAIKETVGILTAEESRAHFEKTKPASFLQLSARVAMRSKSLEEKRSRVVEVLRRANIPELSLLATRTQLAAFDEIKKMIADLIKDLNQKKADEIKKRDYCIAEFDSNKKETDETSNEIEDLGAEVEKLEAKSKALAEAIKNTDASQKKLRLSIASATTLRAESSAEYQVLYQDYLTTKEILNKAIVRLNEFYGKKSFLSVSQEPAPVGLKKDGYKKKNGGGVIGMIRMIIEDAAKTAVEAQSDEAAAQASYEKSMADAVTETGTLKATFNSQTEEKADTDSDTEARKSDQQSALHKLEDLNTANKGLHGECDFLMTNFDNRQAGFAQEAEALQQAIEILSGAGLQD